MDFESMEALGLSALRAQRCLLALEPEKLPGGG